MTAMDIKYLQTCSTSFSYRAILSPHLGIRVTNGAKDMLKDTIYGYLQEAVLSNIY